MKSLIVENVRCFEGRHVIPLGRLTIVVGENSSGKSTLLALVRLAASVVAGEMPEFNAPPFLWGAFDHIVTYREGAGAGRRFLIGAEVELSGGDPATAVVTATFDDRGGQPRMVRWEVVAGDLRIESMRVESADEPCLRIEFASGDWRSEYQFFFGLDDSQALLRPVGLVTNQLRFGFPGVEFESAMAGTPHPGPHVWTRFDSLLARLTEDAPPTRAIAPVRSRPERTYDPIIRSADAGDGAHIPQLLARLARTDPARWVALRGPLETFGRASGLFSGIEVSNKGDQPSDPFQVHVRPGDHMFNVIDVGYGVSQALPLVVEALEAPPGTTLLLQQPEVHLHPRAQAAMGSFLARLTGSARTRVIVETHSDHLLDRVLIEIRDHTEGTLRASDLSLLYAHRDGDHARLDRVTVSETGDIVDPPEGYRAFFLEEEARLLGLS